VNANAFAAARAFVYQDARLLERRLFATLFEGAPADGVVDAVRGYRNPDGGFGHALEPDKRAPQSQPLDVLFALETLDTAGAFPLELVLPACDFLASVADASGALPIVLPSVADYPRANHWADGQFPPTLSPAVGIVALLAKHGVDHPWRERAEAYCWNELEQSTSDDAHAIRDAVQFVEHAPDRIRAEPLAARLADQLRKARYFRTDPDDTEYGLTPLDFATSPESPWRTFLTDAEIEGHLDRLERDQEDDGGWPLSWEPPTDASRLEWRGRVTVDAVRVLTAYGRVARV
jgi:hypothetical protein